MTKSIQTLLSRAGTALAAGALLAGCAALSPRPSPAEAEAIEDLEATRSSLSATEDSLILDLLVGYRVLAAGAADPQALRRAREARTRIEYMLRHGGVKEHGLEGRVVTLPDGQKLTLRQAVDGMSEALLRNAPGTAWRPESERAREIQRHRRELSFLVEDAEWVLTLAAALEGSLPEDEKRRLRRLHEDYAANAPHAGVAAQVNALLNDIPDERLRRELKQLANRSWERERGREDTSAAAAPPPPLPAAPPPEDKFKRVPRPDPSLSPGVDPLSGAWAHPDSLSDPQAAPPASPERYCEERRSTAARIFASARATPDDSARTRLLNQSLELLDDCLQRHPDTEAAQKARRNREMVQQALEKPPDPE